MSNHQACPCRGSQNHKHWVHSTPCLQLLVRIFFTNIVPGNFTCEPVPNELARSCRPCFTHKLCAAMERFWLEAHTSANFMGEGYCCCTVLVFDIFSSTFKNKKCLCCKLILIGIVHERVLCRNDSQNGLFATLLQFTIEHHFIQNEIRLVEIENQIQFTNLQILAKQY